jgi:serine/threonine protein kinase
MQFGKYTLFERIGRGGMADVFKARVQGPAGFERVFVVKRILPHLSDDPQFTKMFIEEAKLSARLNHPNVVQVFELGAVENEYFIAMEYVKGRDLSETMRTLWNRVGPPRPELVAYIGREMCRALAYAHDLTGDDGSPVGMIHRDVSPSNVMLSYEGAVKILDFGIAKALGSDQQEESNTQRGTLKGKFAYMAPEQTQGSDVDKRIDIFAAGIVLHEVLTGRRLFKGENDLQTVEKVRQCDVPPPSLHNQLCSPELDEVILRALAKNRDERFQTATDMADALDDIVHAARFQPTHLAQLMRDLFPGDVGGSAATGSARVTQPLSGSNSRSHSVAMRSPTTVPPVSVSRSASVARPLATQEVPIPTPPPAPPPTPFYKKPGLWIGGILAVTGAFVGGALVMRANAPVQVVGSAVDGRAVLGKLSVKIDSLPDGADIYEVGTDKLLGTTPKIVTFDFKNASKFSIVLRKPGFEDSVKEVRPHMNVLATLKRVVPEKPGKAGAGKSASPSSPRGSEPRPAGESRPSDREPSAGSRPSPSEAPGSGSPRDRGGRSSGSYATSSGSSPSGGAPGAPSAPGVTNPSGSSRGTSPPGDRPRSPSSPRPAGRDTDLADPFK